MQQISASIPDPKDVASTGLIKLLTRLNLVPQDKIDAIIKLRNNTKLIYVLDRKGYLDEAEALDRIASELGINVVKSKEFLDAGSLSRLIDRKFAYDYRCFPIAETEKSYVFAMADPLDMEVISRLEFNLQMQVDVAVAKETDIVSAIKKYLSIDEEDFIEEFDRLEKVDNSSRTVEVIIDPNEAPDDKVEADTAPVVRLVNKILSDASQMDASDIHLDPTGEELGVNFRIDGIISNRMTIPRRLQHHVVARIKILSGMNIAEKRRPQDGSFRMRVGRTTVRDLRVSSVPTPYGENLVLRLLPANADGFVFEELGMEPAMQRQVEQILQMPERMLVVTGPTGSGKSTTIYSALNYLRKGTNNIITVEDPIEFRMPGITQIQVNPGIGITFAAGLRSILRQDPDVIFVGEIRDLETAESAFQAAQTGHLVLTTLHTNDCIAATVRLEDLGLEPFVISASLGGVLAQRLVRILCKECSIPLSKSEQVDFSKKYGLAADNVRKAVGCSECNNLGYRGRKAIYSFLPITPAVRRLIRENAAEEEIRAAAKEVGFEEIYQAGLTFVERGETSLSELERVIGAIPSSGKAGTTQISQKSKTTKSFENPVTERHQDGNEGKEMSIAELVAGYKGEDPQTPSVTRVLLVDDDNGVRAVMALALEKAGFEVVSAASGQDALNEIKKNLPDLLICDLMMPGLDGKELTKMLRASPDTQKLPILMLTALDDEQHEIELIDAGVDDFVSKASSPTLVIARAKRLLSK